MATKEVPLRPRQIDFAGVWRWARRLPVLPLIMLAPLLIFGIFGPLLYLHDPHTVNFAIALQPPAWLPGGDWSYPLGTDPMGRDLFTRLVEGARVSLLVGIFGVLVANFIGTVIGLVAGYFGRAADQVLMRLVDVWMGVPGIFFTLMFVAVMRTAGIQGLLPVIIAIGLTMWPMCARMVRAEVLAVKQLDYVAIAKVMGASNSRILVKHLFPNVMNTVVVLTSVGLGGAIMMESGLSFLGVGVLPPNTSWGMLIATSVGYMSSAWWIPVFAGVVLTMSVLGANLMGDWFRDTLDPRTRQSAIT